MIDFITNKLFPFLQKKWQTKLGLLVEIIILLAGFTYLFLQTGLMFLLYLLPVSVSIWLFCWSILSCRIIINPANKKIILISFNIEMGAKKQFDRIIPILKNKLVELSLNTKIKLLIGAEDLISNTKEAEKYRKKSNVDLIVWGNTIYGGLNEKKASQFNVHHTFKITPSLQQKLPLFLGDITLMLQKRNWTIYEMNDIADHKIVADDLLETCLFIIGLYFFDQQEFDDAIKIFESILPISLNKSKIREEQNIMYMAQTGRINSLLIDLYFIKSTEFQEKGDVNGELYFLNKIPEKIQNQIPILMNLAKTYYQINDLNKAVKYTLKIKKINKNHPAVAINLAFFGILQKNYARVKFWYDQLLKHDHLSEIPPINLLEFLDNEFKKNPSEYALLYGMAIINNFLDKIMMKRYLRQFLKSTKQKDEYILLQKRAEELVK